MYAILKHGGHQYRVSAGDHVVVDRLSADVGDVVGLEPVLLLSDGDSVQLAGSELEGMRVAATVVAHRRGRKLRVFTFKPKKRHRRMLGFRAELTELVVDQVVPRGEPLPERVQVEELEAEGAPAHEAEAEPVSPRPRRRRAAAAAVEAAQPEAAPEARAEPSQTLAAQPEPADTAVASPRRATRRARPAPAEPAAAEEAVEGTATEPTQARRAPRRAGGRTSASGASAGAEPGADAAVTDRGSPRRRGVGRRDQPAGEESE